MKLSVVLGSKCGVYKSIIRAQKSQESQLSQKSHVIFFFALFALLRAESAETAESAMRFFERFVQKRIVSYSYIFLVIR